MALALARWGSLHAGALLVCMVLLFSAPSQSLPSAPVQSPPNKSGEGTVFPVHGWDVYFNWVVPGEAPTNSKWKTDVYVEVSLDPGAHTYYYWSHFTFFTDKRPAPGSNLSKEPGAYIGLQTNGNHKSVVFSAWNGVSAISDKSPHGMAYNNVTSTTNSYCKPFGNDTSGYHCFYTYDWIADVKYRFRMELSYRSAWGDGIRGSMLDTVSGQEIVIGEIFVPAFLGSPLCSVLFYEYFGAVTECAAIPPAAATFSHLSLTLDTNTHSYPADWTSVTSMLNGAGGGACVGWASLDICNTTVSGSSPAVPVLTEAQSNRCEMAPRARSAMYRPVPIWEHQVGGDSVSAMARLPRMATYACLDLPASQVPGGCVS